MRAFVCLVLCCGCAQRYFIPDSSLRESASAPDETILARRLDSNQPVSVRPRALRFDEPVSGGRIAAGRRLHPVTGAGLGVAVVGAAMLIVAGGLIGDLRSKAHCVEWCGFPEAVASMALIGQGSVQVLLGSGMALGTLGWRDAEPERETSPKAPLVGRR